MNAINIAIDGYSSCGKSTLAKQLAAHLGYIYIDSGAMYRAITLFAIENQLFDSEGLDLESLLHKLPEIDVRFDRSEKGRNQVLLNGVQVENKIREMRVSERVSEIAAIPEVRHKLVKLQQAMAADKGVVMDGRDIGTHVMPDAELKLFMTASPEIRAQRRYDELKAKGMDVSYEEVLKNLSERDETDSNRATNPLRQADDAIVFDNSHLTPEAQFNRAIELVKEVTPLP